MVKLDWYFAKCPEPAWGKLHVSSILPSLSNTPQESAASVFGTSEVLQLPFSQPRIWNKVKFYHPRSWTAQEMMGLEDDAASFLSRWLNFHGRTLKLRSKLLNSSSFSCSSPPPLHCTGCHLSTKHTMAPNKSWEKPQLQVDSTWIIRWFKSYSSNTNHSKSSQLRFTIPWYHMID